MYLSKATVKNFRNLQDLTVDFSEGLNVLVGENNAGKTNLLEAIRICLGQQFSNGERLSREDFYRDKKGVTTKDSIRIDLFFSGLTDDEHAEFIEILNYNPDNPKESTASIHYQCGYTDKSERLSFKRWGGNRENTEAAVPEDVTQSIQSTLLHALRDAVSSLAPGRQNRLGKLISSSSNKEDESKISEIFKDANNKIATATLVTKIEEQLNDALAGATGAKKKQNVKIRATDPDFEQIVRSLRIVLKLDDPDSPTHELRYNGLGYNNILFLATVLAELEATKDATLPLFLVEEPEAHLHPQLQNVLIKFLEKGLNEKKSRTVQTIVTTHSPSIAAYVPLKSIKVIHKDAEDRVRCFPLQNAGLDEKEEQKLKRMFDVTKATLLFSRGVIFVEGITENLLIPVLADRSSKQLEESHITVIPMCGVDFGTVAKLFGPDKLNIPVSIITDGDPEIEHETGVTIQTWKNEIPKGHATENYPPAPRVAGLRKDVSGNPNIEDCVSKVTLEFDLAHAGNKNAEVMCDAWDSLSESGRSSSVLKKADVQGKAENKDKALLVWRGICRSSTTRTKGEFAQALLEKLSEKNKDGIYVVPSTDFVIPEYILKAFNHVLK
ncbi:MAG: AAA family ATPase [Bdellovibrio sp.]